MPQNQHEIKQRRQPANAVHMVQSHLGGVFLRRAVLRALCACVMFFATLCPSIAAPDLANTLYLSTKDGRIVIQLRPDLAPKHVAQIKALVKSHFYDGIVFHRVIEGFMAQTGDPTGTGTGGSKLPNIAAEFTDAPFLRGTVGMARASDPNSANSQFFICLKDSPFLNGKYTVFGEVTEGMDVVDKIKKGDAAQNGQVYNPDKIITLRLASDK